ncbi:LiaF domain-containing protein [Pseudoalteromonas mariniglutinosa]|uniref:LiaF domain-containing protein n=1 Tax=Pseudoalteromonas mariniglutinosa TaxID=206042 RepID=UPI00384FDAF5
MTVKLEDRPIEQVREEVIDQLIYNYSHAVISAQAFERRLDQAMAAKDNHSLRELTADLSLQADSQYQSEKRTQFSPNYSPHNGEEKLHLRSILGNNERSGQWLVPKEIHLTNIMGSIELDFTDAIFQHQNVTLYVNCMLGSDEIFVPEHVNVVSKMFSVIGSVENKSVSLNKHQGPTITIEGKVVLGSVEIKIKRTMKEKFVTFAHSLRNSFKNMSRP